MRNLSIILFIPLFLSGCIYSENPFFSEDIAIIDPSFQGTFKSKDSEETYIVFKNIDKSYSIVEQSTIKKEAMRGTVIKLNEYYLNVEMYDDEINQNVHYLFKLKINKNKFLLYPLDPEYFTVEVREELNLNANSKSSDTSLTHFTSSTETLFQMLQTIQNNNKAFGQKLTFIKLK